MTSTDPLTPTLDEKLRAALRHAFLPPEPVKLTAIEEGILDAVVEHIHTLITAEREAAQKDELQNISRHDIANRKDTYFTVSGADWAWKRVCELQPQDKLKET